MARVSVVFDVSRYVGRLSELLNKLEHKQELMQDLARYMVRSTRNRILRQKVSPSGKPWAPLSEVTIALKDGRSQPLFDTGSLAESIAVAQASNDGFTVSSNVPYGGYMQFGVKRTGGFIPGRTIPARPFMGYSDANVRVIEKMIRKHLEGRGGITGGDE
jgi:phage virion morphogenesis protein